MVMIISSSTWLVPLFNTGLRPAWVYCLSKEQRKFYDFGDHSEHKHSVSKVSQYAMRNFYHLDKCTDAKIWEDHRDEYPASKNFDACGGGHH